MEFSRPEYWSGQTFPSPGYLPNSGIEPRSPALQVDSLPAKPQGKPILFVYILFKMDFFPCTVGPVRKGTILFLAPAIGLTWNQSSMNVC